MTRSEETGGEPVLWYWSPAVGEIQCSELEKYYCCYFQYITSRHQHQVNGGRGSQCPHANIVNYLLMSTEELGGIYGVTLTLLIAGAKLNRSGKSEAKSLQMNLTEMLCLCIKYLFSTYCRGAPWLEVRDWLMSMWDRSLHQQSPRHSSTSPHPAQHSRPRKLQPNYGTNNTEKYQFVFCWQNTPLWNRTTISILLE